MIISFLCFFALIKKKEWMTYHVWKKTIKCFDYISLPGNTERWRSKLIQCWQQKSQILSEKHLQTHFFTSRFTQSAKTNRNKQSQQTLKEAHLVVTGSFNVCVWICECEYANNAVVTWRSQPQETGRLPQRNDWQLIVFGEGLGGSKDIIK